MLRESLYVHCASHLDVRLLGRFTGIVRLAAAMRCMLKAVTECICVAAHRCRIEANAAPTSASPPASTIMARHPRAAAAAEAEDPSGSTRPSGGSPKRVFQPHLRQSGKAHTSFPGLPACCWPRICLLLCKYFLADATADREAACVGYGWLRLSMKRKCSIATCHL